MYGMHTLRHSHECTRHLDFWHLHPLAYIHAHFPEIYFMCMSSHYKPLLKIWNQNSIRLIIWGCSKKEECITDTALELWGSISLASWTLTILGSNALGFFILIMSTRSSTLIVLSVLTVSATAVLWTIAVRAETRAIAAYNTVQKIDVTQ